MSAGGGAGCACASDEDTRTTDTTLRRPRVASRRPASLRDRVSVVDHPSHPPDEMTPEERAAWERYARMTPDERGQHP